MKNISLRTYNESLEKLKKRNKEIAEFSEKCANERRELENKYRDLIWDLNQKIRDLERKRDKKIENIKNKNSFYKSEILKRYVFNQQYVDYTQKIFGMIDLFDNELEETIPLEPVDIIADDNYKKIYVEIANNNKPVNCCDLIIHINHIFSNIMYSNTISYILRMSAGWRGEDFILKSSHSKEILLKWYQKNKSHLKFKRKHQKDIYLFKDVLSELSELETIYKQAQELYKQTQWQLAYLYYKKYYYENYYSNGKETEEYKSTLERIKIIKTERKNLPLLIADIETEKGREEFSKKLR